MQCDADGGGDGGDGAIDWPWLRGVIVAHTTHNTHTYLVAHCHCSTIRAPGNVNVLSRHVESTGALAS